jgi:prepilin-type N-terminal cleavage/methylation domain-containing protein
MSRVTRSSGFTLVEVLIVVALIGVLATVAVPGFLSYQARSRRAEAYVNLQAIAHSQLSYFAVKGFFHGTGLSYPDPVGYGGLGTTKMTWDAASETAFSQLGWAPEGGVLYSYETNTPSVAGSGCTCNECFTSTAFGDVDANGTVSAVMYSHPQDIGGVILECPARTFPLWAPTRLGTTHSIYDEVAINRSNDEF